MDIGRSADEVLWRYGVCAMPVLVVGDRGKAGRASQSVIKTVALLGQNTELQARPITAAPRWATESASNMRISLGTD